MGQNSLEGTSLYLVALDGFFFQTFTYVQVFSIQ